MIPLLAADPPPYVLTAQTTASSSSRTVSYQAERWIQEPTPAFGTLQEADAHLQQRQEMMRHTDPEDGPPLPSPPSKRSPEDVEKEDRAKKMKEEFEKKTRDELQRREKKDMRKSSTQPLGLKLASRTISTHS